MGGGISLQLGTGDPYLVESGKILLDMITLQIDNASVALSR
jgi:hypothetical protein